MLRLPAKRKGFTLTARIAAALREAVKSGRLVAGARLAGSRELAEKLGVSRKSVVHAYNQLTLEGVFETKLARGTFVCASSAPQRTLASAPPSMPLAHVSHRFAEQWPIDATHLSSGAPDTRVATLVDFARSYGRVLRRLTRTPKVLDYGDPRGSEKLRVALCAYLARQRGIRASSREIMITRGSQMALYLCAHALKAPAQIAVESLGYKPAWQAFTEAGHTLAPIALEADGLRTEDLARALRKAGAVYTTPQRQYPTTSVLGAHKREQLLALANRFGHLIIEDDYDHEFFYEGLPVAPLIAAKSNQNVVHVGSFSKVLAPALRIGYVVAHARWIDEMAALRVSIDRQGDTIAELAMADLIESGELERHQRRARKVYRARRDHLVQALTAQFGDALSFVVPAGGLSLWVRAQFALEPWQKKLTKAGFHLATEADFCDSRIVNSSSFRLGFGAFSEKEIDHNVAVMRACLKPGTAFA